MPDADVGLGAGLLAACGPLVGGPVGLAGFALMGVRLGYLGGDVLYELSVRLTDGDRHVGNVKVQVSRQVHDLLMTFAATNGLLDLNGTLVLSLDQAEAVGDALLEAVEMKRSADVGTDPEAAA